MLDTSGGYRVINYGVVAVVTEVRKRIIHDKLFTHEPRSSVLKSISGVGNLDNEMTDDILFIIAVNKQ